MAHFQQFCYVQKVNEFLPDYFQNTRVLEVGSLNINGSVRQFFKNCDYTGLDVGAGLDVDVVCAAEHYSAAAETFDVIISCEAMEHNPAWRLTWLNMLRMLKPTGLVIMSCASLGRKQHGTAEYSPSASPLTVGLQQNYYQNLVAKDFSDIANLDSWFVRHAFHMDYSVQDLYMFGIGSGSTAVAQADCLTQDLDVYYYLRNTEGRC